MCFLTMQNVDTKLNSINYEWMKNVELGPLTFSLAFHPSRNFSNLFINVIIINHFCASRFDFLFCFCSSISKLFNLIYICYHYESLSVFSGHDTWGSYAYHIKYNMIYRRGGQLNCNYQVHGNSRFSICMYVSWLMNTCLSLDPGWTLSVYFYYIHISTST